MMMKKILTVNNPWYNLPWNIKIALLLQLVAVGVMVYAAIDGLIN
jgi:hypothetical protein